MANKSATPIGTTPTAATTSKSNDSNENPHEINVKSVGQSFVSSKSTTTTTATAATSTTTFAPILVHSIRTKEKYILLPSTTSITVQSFRTGHRLCHLRIPKDLSIQCCCADARSIWVGCTNSILLHYSLTELDHHNKLNKKMSSNLFSTHFILPRSQFRVVDDKSKLPSIVALTSAPSKLNKRTISNLVSGGKFNDKEDSTVIQNVLYAVLSDASSTNLARVCIPKSNGSNEIVSLCKYPVTYAKKTTTTMNYVHIFGLRNESALPSNTVPVHFTTVHNAANIAMSSEQYQRKQTYGQQEKIPAFAFLVLVFPTSCIAFRDTFKNKKIGTLKKPVECEYPIYLDRLCIPKMKTETITCSTISPNGCDLTCGYSSGAIRVFYDVVAFCIHYYNNDNNVRGIRSKSLQLNDAKSPASRSVVRQFHWHAHAVQTLAYNARVTGGDDQRGDVMLHSGGIESVLLTWQLSRGSYRPSEILPRVGLGPILHILYDSNDAGDDSIVMYCADNTAQRITVHNKGCPVWKLRGVAHVGATSLQIKESSTVLKPIMSVNHHKNTLRDTVIVTGFHGVPGYMHWYDPSSDLIVSTLEVAPYNRVSSIESYDTPIPEPVVTHCGWSSSGCAMATVDMTPTENETMGCKVSTSGNDACSVITSLKFWTISDSSSAPYRMAAIMSFPHGKNNLVTAMAVSPDGNHVCTVSNDECAFRLWHRNSQIMSDWTCRCKVSTPSGYANFPTASSFAVSYSADNSVLAVAYGGTVTVWDHEKSVSLLSSFRHSDDSSDGCVQSVRFATTGGRDDMMLIVSKNSVSIRPPYTKNRVGDHGWIWQVPASLLLHTTICCATNATMMIPTTENDESTAIAVTAIGLYNTESNKTRIVFVDSVTGKPQEQQQYETLEGEVCSMEQQYHQLDVLQLHVLTTTGKMYVLQQQQLSRSTNVRAKNPPKKNDVAATTSKLPKLALLASAVAQSNNKKRDSTISVYDIRHPNKKHRNELFDTDDTPLLSSFTQAYVSRNLKIV